MGARGPQGRLATEPPGLASDVTLSPVTLEVLPPCLVSTVLASLCAHCTEGFALLYGWYCQFFQVVKSVGFDDSVDFDRIVDSVKAYQRVTTLEKHITTFLVVQKVWSSALCYFCREADEHTILYTTEPQI